MLLKLRTIIYHVHDLDKAKQWYTELTGITPYFDESFYVGFNINGCELGLDPDMNGIVEGGQSVSYWAVAAINVAVEKAVAIGAIVVSPVTNVGGSIEVAIVKDPFGNSIGLIEGA